MHRNDSISIPGSQLPPTPPSELSTHLDQNIRMPSISGDDQSAAPRIRHFWIITGPAGCGKTSIAEFLHTSLSLPYLEGDTYHTPANVKKMAEGHPLEDADRWDWLICLREEALKALRDFSGVIVTCSALKRKYRDVMRIAAYHNPHVRVHFVFLNASEALLLDRVRARQNHYMKDSMVHSQFESLETPHADEIDVLSVDASGTSKQVQELAISVVKETLAQDATII